MLLFTKKERNDIMKHYHLVTTGDKPCDKYPRSIILKAARGMYMYPDLDNIKTQEICGQLMKSRQSKDDPIAHEDSITAWGNKAAAQYGLEIRDILKMKPNYKMKVILLDRNIGEYTHGTKKGKRLNPKKRA